jgi:hypothetical protein
MRHNAAIAELLSLGHMRTSLAILALALGCFGCHENQTSTREIVVAAPAPEPGERPSFYDSNNSAEYYGHCPKCQRWVKGYYINMLIADASGKPVGCEAAVTGKCEHCRVYLFADESGSLTNESRIVRWRASVSAARAETHWLDSVSIGFVATNTSPIVFPK